MQTRFGGEALGAEFASAQLGDVRRTRRLVQLATAAVGRPEASFPAMLKNTSELEAAYRFLSNPDVRPEDIVEPHVQASVARGRASGSPVLVAHDTTYFTFEGDREGLGRVHVTDHGFWAHVALAMSASRAAHGVVGFRYGTRLGPSRWKGGRKLVDSRDEDSESLRWLQVVEDVSARFGPGEVIHLMDREGDWFELLHALVERGERFVIRLAHDRLVEEGGRVSEGWSEMVQSVVAERTVWLSARAEGDSARQRKRHPERKARLANLKIEAKTFRLRSSTSPGILELQVVRVVELDPPADAAPVVWNLVTTEPVTTQEEVLRVVDAYRARWTIEEYFKALKTGCAIEKRQLGSYAALLNALGVFLPIAWTLLQLRDAVRAEPPPPGKTLLTPNLIIVLRAISERIKVPAEPTAKDITYAVAGLGGHLKRNGDPGWQTLARGLERLLDAAAAVAAIRGIEM